MNAKVDTMAKDNLIESFKLIDLRLVLEIRELFYYLEGIYFLNDKEMKKVLETIDLELFKVMFIFFPRCYSEGLVSKFSLDIKIDPFYKATLETTPSDTFTKLMTIEKKLKTLSAHKVIDMSQISRESKSI